MGTSTWIWPHKAYSEMCSPLELSNRLSSVNGLRPGNVPAILATRIWCRCMELDPSFFASSASVLAMFLSQFWSCERRNLHRAGFDHLMAIVSCLSWVQGLTIWWPSSPACHGSERHARHLNGRFYFFLSICRKLALPRLTDLSKDFSEVKNAIEGY